jgi:predicted phage-related endonuclease
LTDLSADLRELSEPWEMGDRIKAAIDRAARRAGLSYWRTFDLWYGKARRVEPHEREAIAAALAQKRKEAARNELHELRTRLARLEALLARDDPDFHRASPDPIRR